MTDTEQDLLAELVGDLVERHPPFVLSPERPWDPSLWADLVATGLTALGDDEPLTSVPTAVNLLAGLARGAAAVPLAEHLLVARPLLAAAGLQTPAPEDVITFATGDLTGTPGPDGTWVISGRATSPWLSIAKHVLLVADSGEGIVLGLASPSEFTVHPGVNMAGEPREELVAHSVQVHGVGASRRLLDDLHTRYALARAAQLSGALQQILILSVHYAQIRQQFGRSIGRFQAVQFMVADIAEEVALVASSVQAAANAIASSRRDAAALTAACKINAGNAVGIVARSAHQIHGAIGFTQEHELHHLTRRCWSWRDEARAELHHARMLNTALNSGDEAGSFWTHITGTAGMTEAALREPLPASGLGRSGDVSRT